MVSVQKYSVDNIGTTPAALSAFAAINEIETMADPSILFVNWRAMGYGTATGIEAARYPHHCRGTPRQSTTAVLNAPH